jgi:hypothetical protein
VRLAVPEKPADGHELHYWRFSSTGDSLVHHKLIYVVGPTPVEDVFGPWHKGRGGIPIANEWASFERYEPGDVEWRGSGRYGRELHRNPYVDEENGASFATFAEARSALIVHLEKAISRKRREVDRLAKRLGALLTMKEPPP